MALGSTQPLTGMSTRNLPGRKERPAREADKSKLPFSRQPITAKQVLWLEVSSIVDLLNLLTHQPKACKNDRRKEKHMNTNSKTKQGNLYYVGSNEKSASAITRTIMRRKICIYIFLLNTIIILIIKKYYYTVRRKIFGSKYTAS
jgi:hypothetical protein